MNTPISIVIPAFNQLEYCKQCIQSILLNTDVPYKLILVDNGSTDGVSEYFDSVPDAVVIHAAKNLGFAGGTNLGMRQAEGHVLLLNSDTIVPHGWLSRLERALMKDHRIGLLGPRSNCVSGIQQIDGLDFNSMDQINTFSDQLARENAGKLTDVARLIGFCLLIRDRVFQEVGYLDEAYGIGNFEDDDYCIRTLRAGYRLCMADDCFVFHYGNRTFLSMGIVDEQWHELLNRNEQIFQEKWEARPEERSNAVQQSRQFNHQARQAVDRNDLVEAIKLYKEAIACAPFYEINYNDLGVVVWQMGDHHKACEYFSLALRCNPNYVEAQENLHQAKVVLKQQE
jgi:glycosyltransferase involved in cell wall biosynthesis